MNDPTSYKLYFFFHSAHTFTHRQQDHRNKGHWCASDMRGLLFWHLNIH